MWFLDGDHFHLQSDRPVSMNVKSVWEAGYTGEGILVAVVDDGVKITHPGLKPNVVSTL